RLRSRQPGERHTIGRAADVVEPQAVAERDRVRLAAVLAADAELDAFLAASDPLDGAPLQVADPAPVERLERVPLEHAVLEVAGQELALSVVAREAERRLREVVRAEGEEVRVLGDLVGADAGARELDHRPDEVLHRLALFVRGRDRDCTQAVQLFGEADKRVHDLDERRLTGALLDRLRRPDDRAHLHLVDLGPARALAASSGVSAFARTLRRRRSSAQPRIVSKSSLICGGTRSTEPTITLPVPPSIVITSPSESFWPPIVSVRASASIVRPSHPATHGLPIPRATTAAWEVMPPCAVRIPAAWLR